VCVQHEKIRNLDDDFVCSVLTNFANTLSYIGRLVEANDFFDKAIRVKNHFAMGIGNKGFLLRKYSDWVFEEKDRLRILQDSKKYLERSLEIIKGEEVVECSFRKCLSYVNSKLDVSNSKIEFMSESQNESGREEEKEYTDWCVT
jgi:hypothetical protein